MRSPCLRPPAYGTVPGHEGKSRYPLCEGYGTVPQEIAERFVEAAMGRMQKSDGA